MASLRDLPFVTCPVWGERGERARGLGVLPRCALPRACTDVQLLGAPCTELPRRLFLITFNCWSFLLCPSRVLKK